jgi:hypothetical protein
VYDLLAETLLEKFQQLYLLSKEYNFLNQGGNLGALPLTNFLKKIIIGVDSSIIKTFGPKLDEIANFSTGQTVQFNQMRFNEVLNIQGPDDFTNQNRRGMTIILPNLNYSNDNYAFGLTQEYGSQMSAMCFQNNDAQLQAYNNFYANKNSAFILKPKKLRYIPVTIPMPAPPPPEYSYKPRPIKSDFYSFTV